MQVRAEINLPGIVSPAIPTQGQLLLVHGPGFTSVFGANTLPIEAKIVSLAFL